MRNQSHFGLLWSFLILTNTVFAQPLPGDIFREYVWLPTMVKESEKFLRVGGKLDYKTATQHMPANFHMDGHLPLAGHVDLGKAIRAEVILEMVQSHEATKGLAIQVNQRKWIPVPDLSTLPKPQSAYMLHTYPAVEIPVEYLKEGRENLFKLKVDSNQTWKWPQNIFYGVIFRVYYSENKINHQRSRIASLKNGDILQDSVPLLVNVWNHDSTRQVDYIGYYKDFNWEGDGQYQRWHGHTHRGKLQNHIGTSHDPGFKVVWNTGWLPDQSVPIKVMARVERNDGIVYITEPVSGLTLDRDFSVELCKPYHQPPNWVTRSDTFQSKFSVHGDLAYATSYQVGWRSWSPCYGRGLSINRHQIWDRQDPCYGYAEHLLTMESTGDLVFGENRIETGKTPLIDGKMVHGMEVQYPGVMVKVKYTRKPAYGISIREGEYEGRPHYIIRTEKAVYYYDKMGGGFSRMLDLEGNDWIDFRMNPWDQYPEAAASAYRGIPNLVFKSDMGGAGHPGHDRCSSIKINDYTIESRSENGLWQWKWGFFDDFARLEIVQTDPNHAYWFLYEGVPGGKWEPSRQYFGTNIEGPIADSLDFYQGNKNFGNWEWAYFGHQKVDRVLFIKQEESDNLSDIFSYLGNSENGIHSFDGMVVFGFGRAEGAKPLMQDQNIFYLGFIEQKVTSKEDHEKIYPQIEFTKRE